MQAGRGFAKPFPKLPYMRGEGGLLPSCHILPSRLPNCWRGVLSIFVKNQGCQLHLPDSSFGYRYCVQGRDIPLSKKDIECNVFLSFNRILFLLWN
jgi:hypothetical protein